MARQSLKTGREPIIEHGKFTIDSAKMYLIALLICFHIVPLIFVIVGDMGRQILTNMFMLVLNPILIFVILFFYGIRLGFNFKMPLISGIITTASILMYYDFGDVASNASQSAMASAVESMMTHAVQSAIIMFIVYTLFSYGSALIGAFVKRYI